MDAFFTPPALLALITLTFLEIVLAVDTVIFISISVVQTSGIEASSSSTARAPGNDGNAYTAVTLHCLGDQAYGSAFYILGCHHLRT